MAILQISTSNTFAQWLSTTQQLVEKYNYFEANANTVIQTASDVSNVNTYIQTFASDSTNTINVLIANATVNVTTAQNVGYANIVSAQSNAYSNVVTIQSTAYANIFTTQSDAYANLVTIQSTAYANVNTIYQSAVTLSILVQDKSNTTNTTAQTVFDYVDTAFDTANTSNTIANEALVTAQLAFNIANNALSNVEIQAIATASYAHANGAFDKANSANVLAQNSYNFANTVNSYSQSAYGHANSAFAKANSQVVTITDDVTNNTTLYLLMSQQSSNNLTSSNTSTTKLYFNPETGTLNSTNYNSLSDERLKNNVITINNPIGTIQQLDGVEFNWKENGKKSYGLIAQELEKILPELVEGTDVKTVNYTGLIAFLVNGIKELDNRVTQLENGINK